MTIFLRAATVLAVLAGLAGCGREEILPGERFGTRVPLAATLSAEGADAAGGAADPAAGDAPRPISLPAPVDHAAWPQRGGTARNAIAPAALPPAPRLLFATDIGEGNSRRNRITAIPVAADGRVFTMDATAGVTAVSAGGEVLWRADLTPDWERGGNVSGGGLAVGGGALVATTGYGEVVAMEPATGAVLWRQRLQAGITAPTVAGGLVYIVSRDAAAWAIEAETGRLRWSIPGVPAQAVRQSGAAPAVTDRLVIFPFGSGEVQAVLRQSGLGIWRSVVAGDRRGVAYTIVSDITGDPVVAGDRLYVGNLSGRVAAMDPDSGERDWTASEGAYGPVVPAGGSVFFVSDRNELIRLDAASGARVWGTELPLYEARRERRRSAVFAHYGPILAGGRLVVASNDGLIRFFDPESGAETGALEIRGGAASMPIVVNGVLYLVGGDGRLYAYG